MANSIGRVGYTFRDLQGRTARVDLYHLFGLSAGPTDNVIPVVGGLVTAFQGVSNAHVSSPILPPAPITYGANAVYSSSQDKALLVFTTATGARHQLQVPAPQGYGAVGGSTNIFYADGLTVNPAATGMATLIAAINNAICDYYGNLLTVFVGGIRLRRKLPRRSNIFILAPDDVGPEE